MGVLHPKTAASRIRATADSEPDFEVGEKIVHPSHGVGCIVHIGTEEISGFALDVIQIQMQDKALKIRVPLTKARAVGLRRLADRLSLERAIDIVRARPKANRMMWARKAVEFNMKLNSGDLASVAEVARDTRRPGATDQSTSEKVIYEQALDRLASEMAAVHDIAKVEAMRAILGRVNAE